jgi:hypothetical protein
LARSKSNPNKTGDIFFIILNCFMAIGFKVPGRIEFISYGLFALVKEWMLRCRR